MSVPDDDVEYLDNDVKTHLVGSRSAALQRAIRLLRASELGESDTAAFTVWSEHPHSSGDTATADA